MRTLKTLLCLSALAAGIATSVAQNVYSLNIVGYVNVEMLAGNYTYANPLDKDGTNNAANVLQLPDGTYFSFWTGSAFDYWYYELGAGGDGWFSDGSASTPKPAPIIPPGKGFYIAPPSRFTNTFVGNVLPNPVNTTNSFPVLAGNQLIGSPMPVGGAVTNALFNWTASVPDGTFVSEWTGSAFRYWYYELGAGGDGWFTDGSAATPSAPPVMDVGRSLYIAAPSAWTWKQSLP